MTANTIRQSAAGNLATSRRGGSAPEYDFIVEQLHRRVSVQNIARMTGCSMQDVSRIKERVDVD